MILYRVIPTNTCNINNPREFGLNTFTYDNDDYLHFFILPENAEELQSRKYTINNQKSVVLKCDIPFEFLEFGIGLYNYYYNFKLTPFLEARMKKSNFKNFFIKETLTYVKHEWKNSEIFKRYLINCIYNQKAFAYINFKKTKLVLNLNFNFLHYFSKLDLEKENIVLTDYPENISLKDLKKQELSFINRIFIAFKEGFLMMKDYDINFYDLDYNEKKLKKNNSQNK